MKTKNVCLPIRLCAVCALVTITICGFGTNILTAVCSGLFCGTSLLSLTPLSYEGREISKWTAIVCTALFIMLGITLRHKIILTVPLAGLTVLCYLLTRSVQKYLDLKSSFRSDSPWHGIEDYARGVQRAVLLVTGILAMTVYAIKEDTIWMSVPAALLAWLFFRFYMIAYTGRTGLMTAEKEKVLKSRMAAGTRSCPPLSPAEGDSMSRLYLKVQNYMEERKPYLRPGFSLTDLSREMFTNKTYLSRVINLYSGRNYKQFINHYRVMYAVDLISKDKRLSMEELASMSGFSSVVTFNMAFKINMNDTPGAFRREAKND